MSKRFWCLSVVLIVFFYSLRVCGCPKHCQCNSYVQDATEISPAFYQYVVACERLRLQSFPSDIHPNVTHLYLNENNINGITKKILTKFKSLEKLSISENKISQIELGAFGQLEKLKSLDLSYNRIPEIHVGHFANMSRLRELILTENPIIKVANGAFDNLPSLNSLHLSGTFIQALPVFNAPSSIVHLYLDYTSIKKLTSNSFKHYSQMEGLYLKGSKIQWLVNKVFRHAKQLKYLLMEHSQLSFIAVGAFDGLQLHTLNLQGTSIRSLPAKGLENLFNLNLEGVRNLWKLDPSSLPNIRHLSLTYEFLCCPFVGRTYEDTGEVGPGNQGNIIECKNPPSPPTTSPISRQTRGTHAGTTKRDLHHDPFNFEFSNDSSNPLTLDPCEVYSPPGGSIAVADVRKKKVVCLPRPDNFNPCENILGSSGLRACTWIVAVLAIIGNLVQLVVILLNGRKINNHKLLMLTLAFSNLLTGLYLLILAGVDLGARGHYNRYAKEWQHGNGCKLAGFLSIFSTELAVFTLIIISLERYYNIVYPLHLNMWMTVKQTASSLVFSFFAAIILAVLPLSGVSSYSKVAICLPFDVESTSSKAYVTFLLASNGAAFLAVLFSYIRMYFSIQHSGSTTFADLNMAKKMAVIVLTNFFCWAPIALFSLIAIYRRPLINVPTSKFLLVFVFPINALTNPFLYVIGTQRFKLDALRLLARCGLCKTCLCSETDRDMPTSYRMRTRSITLSTMRTRARSSSGLSNMIPFRRTGRPSSDLTPMTATPRNSVPKEQVRRKSSFGVRVSLLLPSGLKFAGRRRNSTGSSSVRDSRRKSYDLAAKANNILPDAPKNFLSEVSLSCFDDDDFSEARNEFMKDLDENAKQPRVGGDETVFESTC